MALSIRSLIPIRNWDRRVRFPFSKYHGSGNDFILVDDSFFNCEKEFIVSICSRRVGIGADGIVFLRKSSKADYGMQIFNSDGSEAEFCGNGLLCLLNFIKAKEEYLVETLSGDVRCGSIGDRFFFHKKPELIERLSLSGRECFWIDSGVPHLVCLVDDVSKVNVEKEGRFFRFHHHFQPRGVNVDFVDKEGNTRTYERGVEGETLSCGSGAIAAALALHLKEKRDRFLIKFKIGEFEAHVAEDVKLIGSSHFVFSGIYGL